MTENQSNPFVTQMVNPSPDDSPTDASAIILPTDNAPIVRVQQGRFEHLSELSHVVVLSGAFNPVHEGHRQLVKVVARMLGQPVHFELSLTNVDKPALTRREVRRRLSSLADHSVLLTNAPRFIDKARLFPHCRFVVGYDTAVRILDERYYEDSPSGRDDTLQELRSLGARFVVAGRLTQQPDHTVFATVAELTVPGPFAVLFSPLSESQFRVDVSSTEIRRRRDA